MRSPVLVHFYQLADCFSSAFTPDIPSHVLTKISCIAVTVHKTYPQFQDYRSFNAEQIPS